MDVKKRVLALPLAVALALVPACPAALAGSSKGANKHREAATHSAGRKVH
jgi:hypothetical protein